MVARRTTRALFWPGFVLGVGLVGTLDEVVLHQLLGWHHFYDGSTSSVGLASDGLFHIASTALVISGTWLVFRDGRWTSRRLTLQAWAGILCGAGAFNLYDGILQHKLFGFHQVREGVPNDLPYDIVFIALSALLLVGGLALMRASRRART